MSPENIQNYKNRINQLAITTPTFMQDIAEINSAIKQALVTSSYPALTEIKALHIEFLKKIGSLMPKIISIYHYNSLKEILDLFADVMQENCCNETTFDEALTCLSRIIYFKTDFEALHSTHKLFDLRKHIPVLTKIFSYGYITKNSIDNRLEFLKSFHLYHADTFLSLCPITNRLPHKGLSFEQTSWVLNAFFDLAYKRLSDYSHYFSEDTTQRFIELIKKFDLTYVQICLEKIDISLRFLKTDNQTSLKNYLNCRLSLQSTKPLFQYEDEPPVTMLDDGQFSDFKFFSMQSNNPDYFNLINQMSQGQIVYAILSCPTLLLNSTSQNQSDKTYLALLNKIGTHALNTALIISSQISMPILGNLIKNSTRLSLQETFKYITKDTLNICWKDLNNLEIITLLGKYPNDNVSNDILKKLNTTYLTDLIGKLNTAEECNVLLLMEQLELLYKSIHLLQTITQNEIKSFKTSKNTHVCFTDENVFDLVRQEGFASYADAAQLLGAYENHPNRPFLIDLIKELTFYNSLFKGGLTTSLLCSTPDTYLQEKIANFEILYKVIAPDNFEKYIAQFNDYTLRPNDLRKAKPNATHKFFHLSGKIDLYQKKTSAPGTKKTIKKNSTTLLSPKLVTPVYGEHHSDGRPLVGLLFDRKQCVIKAMLKYDRGTINHGWVGSKKEVEKYQQDYQNMNYTNLEEFKMAIEDSSLLNEVLAEIPKEAIVGIFMRNFSNQSEKTALAYADKIKLNLGLDLPIYHYDKDGKALISFARARVETHLDFDRKTQLVNLAKTIRDSLISHPFSLGFFGGKTYTSVDKTITKKLPHNAHAIVTKLDAVLKDDINHRELAITLINISDTLDHAITTSARAESKPIFGRYLTTELSYMALHTKLMLERENIIQSLKK